MSLIVSKRFFDSSRAYGSGKYGSGNYGTGTDSGEISLDAMNVILFSPTPNESAVLEAAASNALTVSVVVVDKGGNISLQQGPITPPQFTTIAAGIML